MVICFDDNLNGGMDIYWLSSVCRAFNVYWGICSRCVCSTSHNDDTGAHPKTFPFWKSDEWWVSIALEVFTRILKKPGEAVWRRWWYKGDGRVQAEWALELLCAPSIVELCQFQVSRYHWRYWCCWGYPPLRGEATVGMTQKSILVLGALNCWQRFLERDCWLPWKILLGSALAELLYRQELAAELLCPA